MILQHSVRYTYLFYKTRLMDAILGCLLLNDMGQNSSNGSPFLAKPLPTKDKNNKETQACNGIALPLPNNHLC